jgi:hypothetical protein
MDNDYPVFREIINNKDILNPSNKIIINNLIDTVPSPDNEEMSVFYTVGMPDDELDENNILDLEIPLTDDYLDGLLNQHLNEHGGQHEQHEGWNDSINQFKQLKKVRDNYMSAQKKICATKMNYDDTVQELRTQLECMPVELSDLKEHEDTLVGSEYRKTKDEWYKNINAGTIGGIGGIGGNKSNKSAKRHTKRSTKRHTKRSTKRHTKRSAKRKSKYKKHNKGRKTLIQSKKKRNIRIRKN